MHSRSRFQCRSRMVSPRAEGPRQWLWLIAVAGVVTTPMLACEPEQDSSAPTVGSGASEVVPSTVSPEELCTVSAAWAAERDSGHSQDNCVFRYGMLKDRLGDEAWAVFSVCAHSAGSAKGTSRCMTEAERVKRESQEASTPGASSSTPSEPPVP